MKNRDSLIIAIFFIKYNMIPKLKIIAAFNFWLVQKNIKDITNFKNKRYYGILLYLRIIKV